MGVFVIQDSEGIGSSIIIKFIVDICAMLLFCRCVRGRSDRVETIHSGRLVLFTEQGHTRFRPSLEYMLGDLTSLGR